MQSITTHAYDPKTPVPKKGVIAMLPTEIVSEIATHLPQSSLPSLLQTCRRWKQAALSALYHHPVLRYDAPCLAFVKTIEQQPSYAKYIRHLTIDNHYLASQVSKIYPLHLDAYLIKILPGLRNLLTLSVDGPDEDPHRCYRCGQNKCLDWPIDQSEELVGDYILKACYESIGPLKDLISVSWGASIEYEPSDRCNLMTNFAYVSPFFVHPHLRNLKLMGGWFGHNEISTQTSSRSLMDEDENTCFPKDDQFRTTPLNTLDFEDCRVLPHILQRFLSAPKALSTFSFQEFFSQDDEVALTISCNSYLNPLLQQKETLRSITIHLFKIAEKWRWCEESLILSSFTNLKYLSIDLITIFGNESKPGSPWLGTHAYLPESVEVLELRAVIREGAYANGCNQRGQSILLKISEECHEALPRLRVVQFREMRCIHTAFAKKTPPVEIDYLQIAENFKSNAVKFSVEVGKDYDSGLFPTWDLRTKHSYFSDHELRR